MKFSITVLALLAATISASPVERRQSLARLLGAGSDQETQDAIAQLEQTFDRNNPNGTPVGPGNEDDLNGDGVINVFEAGAQAGRKRSPQRNIIQQLQDTFDRNNPNGTPVGPGNEDDLNGDGVINVFEAGAQAGRKRSPEPQRNIIQQLQDTFDRNNPNGTPVGPGNEDDLNGDGVINVFEAGAQAGKA